MSRGLVKLFLAEREEIEECILPAETQAIKQLKGILCHTIIAKDMIPYIETTLTETDKERIKATQTLYGKIDAAGELLDRVIRNSFTYYHLI